MKHTKKLKKTAKRAGSSIHPDVTAENDPVSIIPPVYGIEFVDRTPPRPHASATGPQPLIQPKLTMGAANDHHEAEADQAARKVTMGMAGGQMTPIQGKCLHRQSVPDEDEEFIQGKFLQPQRVEKEEEEPLMMKPGSPRAKSNFNAFSDEIEASINRVRGDGRPLPADIQTPMEQSFGADFSDVRIHSDANANQLNRSLKARAFTSAPDIFFRQGEYNPRNPEGRQLLAHELTHVIQQKPDVVTSDTSIAEKTRGPTVDCF